MDNIYLITCIKHMQYLLKYFDLYIGKLTSISKISYSYPVCKSLDEWFIYQSVLHNVFYYVLCNSYVDEYLGTQRPIKWIKTAQTNLMKGCTKYKLWILTKCSFSSSMLRMVKRFDIIKVQVYFKSDISSGDLSLLGSLESVCATIILILFYISIWVYFIHCEKYQKG